MTDHNHAELRQGIVDTCRQMNRNGLNQGTSGNLSHRIPNGMLITPTSLPYDGANGPCAMLRIRTANLGGRFSPGWGFWGPGALIRRFANPFVPIPQASRRSRRWSISDLSGLI